MEPSRKIEDFLRRRRSQYEGNRVFRVLVVTVVLAAYAVTSAGLQQTPTYEASALVWVDWEHEGQWKTLEYRELPPTQEIMHTIGIRSVAQEATQRLGLQMDPDELLDNLTVEQVEGTQFIRLTYESTDPVKESQPFEVPTRTKFWGVCFEKHPIGQCVTYTYKSGPSFWD